MHYPNLSGTRYYEIHWTTCYDNGCEYHEKSKRINDWFLWALKLINKMKLDCPRGDIRCRCMYKESEYPHHHLMDEDECEAIKYIWYNKGPREFLKDYIDGLN